MNDEMYPRSQRYDLDWMVQNSMGSNVVWLTEAIADVMTLEPGMRVLDMGCGKAISSIFLAREFGVEVWVRWGGTSYAWNTAGTMTGLSLN